MFILPPSDNANEIVSRLWLGNSKAAHDEAFLKEKGIHTVFNCSKDIPFHPRAKRCYRVPVDDNLRTEEIRNMELWSFETVSKLCQEYRSGATILVHCAAGMQRSAAVVAMFLLATAKVPADKAMEHIRAKRPIAFMPMANFERAIRGFEASLQKIQAEEVSK
jgi:protein-tyrosine phosphatase